MNLKQVVVWGKSYSTWKPAVGSNVPQCASWVRAVAPVCLCDSLGSEVMGRVLAGWMEGWEE